MIAMDSSAIVAIFQNKEDTPIYARAIENADSLVISAVNAHEIVAFDKDQARAASEAFGCYGKGIHPKARLNLADCAAYALARSLSAPLPFKGDDFANTDVQAWR